MKRFWGYFTASLLLIATPGSILATACGDDGETCVDVSCDHHHDGSKNVYQKCCDQNEEGRTICAYVTSEGALFQCDALDCPEGADAVIAWCREP